MTQRVLAPLLLAVVGFCSPAPAEARQPAQAPGSDNVRVVQVLEAEDVREQLRAILQSYPRAVGEVLRRDPTLMSRPDYMASYPQLAPFLAAHPEVQRNVEFYLEGYGAWQSQPMDPEYEALGVLLGGLAGFMVFSGVIGMLAWTVRAVISHRRWIKASTVQAEVHSKLMDRMTGNEELLAYIQSPAGRRFLEAVPPPKADAETPGFGAPVGSILWSMMAGIVFATVGAGFRVAAGTIGDEVQRAFTVIGIILLSLGLGFLFASLMAFAVSSRLGLFPARPAPQSDSGHA
jgi:hypothetical protein